MKRWRRHLRWLGADQSGSDADQTAADADQTSADTDQSASDRDQAQADSDQRASDRDQAASDQDHELGADRALDPQGQRAYETSRSERAEGTLERDATRTVRVQIASERDGPAQSRDQTARARDRTADERDLAADQSDREAEQLARELGSDARPSRRGSAGARGGCARPGRCHPQAGGCRPRTGGARSRGGGTRPREASKRARACASRRAHRGLPARHGCDPDATRDRAGPALEGRPGIGLHGCRRAQGDQRSPGPWSRRRSAARPGRGPAIEASPLRPGGSMGRGRVRLRALGDGPRGCGRAASIRPWRSWPKASQPPRSASGWRRFATATPSRLSWSEPTKPSCRTGASGRRRLPSSSGPDRPPGGV